MLPALVYSFKMLVTTGDKVVLPLWHPRQSCSLVARVRRVGPAALCGAWQEMHALAATEL